MESRFLLSVFFCLFAASPSFAQSSITYQKPPKAIADLLEAPPTPLVLVSPEAKSGPRTLLIEQPGGLLTITDLAQPELRLAGLRFNPRTNGPSRLPYVISLKFKALPTGKEIAVIGLPERPHIEFAEWSPDAKRVAFVIVTGTNPGAGLSLWTADAATGHAARIPGVALNAVFTNPFSMASPCSWMPDSRSLLCLTVPTGRGPAPVHSEVPTGPAVQQNLGRVTPARTYEDLLKNPEDERFFDYYATAQVRVVSLTGASKPVGKPGIIDAAEPSPDGHYALISEAHHPYSYELPFENFPRRTLVVDLRTGVVKQLSDVPLADNIPIAQDAVATGPRDYQWRSDTPATTAWVEAGAGGDPKKPAPIRDRLFVLDAPFTGSPAPSLSSPCVSSALSGAMRTWLSSMSASGPTAAASSRQSIPPLPSRTSPPSTRARRKIAIRIPAAPSSLKIPLATPSLTSLPTAPASTSPRQAPVLRATAPSSPS